MSASNKEQGSRISEKNLGSYPNFATKQRTSRFDSRADNKSRQLSFLTLTNKIENVNRILLKHVYYFYLIIFFLFKGS
jgi:hypothetical protein